MTRGPEHLVTGALALVALLTFFFPLISIRAPVVGEMNFSGYDIVSKMGQVRERLVPTSASPGNSEETAGSQPQGIHADLKLTLSMRMAGLIPLFIGLAFIGAFFTLAGAIEDLRLARVTSLAGAAFGIIAILHVTVLGSDIRNMLQEAVNSSAKDLAGNPFAGLAQSIGSLMVNAFQLKPGAGLYVLSIMLGLAALLGQTRLLDRMRFVQLGERGPTASG